MAYPRSYFKASYWGGQYWAASYWCGPWLDYGVPDAIKYWGMNYWKMPYFTHLSGGMVDDSAFSKVGSGGITVSGTAATRKDSGWVGVVNTAITLGGSAQTLNIRIRIPSVSGGVTLSGTAPLYALGGWSRTMFGSIYISGAATCSISKIPYTKGSGGIAVQGSAHSMWYRLITADMMPGVPVFITLEQTDLIWEGAVPTTQTDVYFYNDLEAVNLVVDADQAALWL